MLKLITAPLFTLVVFSMFSCGSTKSIAGTYYIDFASLGFFGTTVRLYPDSTLQYVFQGDLMYDSTTGKYTVRDEKVYTRCDKEVLDTTKLQYQFDSIPPKLPLLKVTVFRTNLFFT